MNDFFQQLKLEFYSIRTRLISLTNARKSEMKNINFSSQKTVRF